MYDNNVFSLEIAKSLVESNDQFPVDFDDAWKWLSYSRKDNAKVAFLKYGFIEKVDYLLIQELTTTGIQAHPKEIIKMTIDCFKTWAMMSNTEKGKQVRLYFLECEKIAKSKSASSFNLPQTYKEALIALLSEVEEKEKLQAQNQKLDKINNILVDKIEEDQPKVEFANDVWVTERNMTMGDYSKVIKWGRNKLFAKLRELGIIMPNSNLPYQRWIDAGYFEVTEVVKREVNKAFPFCTVTPKGQLWIHKKLSKVG